MRNGIINEEEWLLHILMWPIFDYACHPKKEGTAFELLLLVLLHIGGSYG
ncbi:hypothetical protein [Sutcliffiella horikoshii]|nr:hypothetical protein [Sutcliffiella horikoshii]